MNNSLPFFHKMIERVFGFILSKSLNLCGLFSDFSSLDFATEGCNFSEFGEEALMSEELDVLDMVVHFLETFELFLWFARIYAFENTKASEISEREL